MTNKRLLFSICCILFLLPNVCLGGWADGPYVVWVNYDDKTPEFMNNIAKKLFNEHDSCIDYTRSPIFYMKKRPKKITNKLVYDALINKNSNSQNELHNALVTFQGKSIWDENNTIHGLDGVIAYIPTPKPRLVSFTFNKYTHKNKIKVRYLKKSNNLESIRDALCEIMPEIARD